MGCKIIAFQGTKGAFSHLACQSLYPEAEILPCRHFYDTLQAVETGQADLAMIPIENSIGGRVAEIHHLLSETKLLIIAEYFQPIEHHLLAQDGISLSEITSIISHPQALMQCQKFLSSLKIDLIEYVDTAQAARAVAANKDKNQAAIASSLAGNIYQLNSLKNNIANNQHNTTRFIIMSPTPYTQTATEQDYITAIIFQLRSVPAALYKALGGFATHNINLLKLESYVEAKSFQNARFYIEIDGHINTPSVNKAIEELKFFSGQCHILGSFPQSFWRKQKR